MSFRAITNNIDIIFQSHLTLNDGSLLN